MCEECYSDKNRVTPLLKPVECLKNHTQNTYVGAVEDVFVLRKIQLGDYKDGISRLNH